MPFASLKQAIRQTIGRHRNAKAIMALHAMATFIESAWHNDDPTFATSGERMVIDRLASAGFRRAMDVGANVGDWTLEAHKSWLDCRIDAFEIAPQTFKILQAAMALLPQSARVELHELGLSDQAGSQRFFYFAEHPKLTGEVDRFQGGLPFEAQTQTLDAFCAERGITAIDFLKIDVEGAEHRVLKGARQLIEADAIACIQFEHGAFWIDSRFLLRDYYDLLGDHFFVGKIFPRYVAFGDYDWREEGVRFCNFLCVSRTRPDLRRRLEDERSR